MTLLGANQCDAPRLSEQTPLSQLLERDELLTSLICKHWLKPL